MACKSILLKNQYQLTLCNTSKLNVSIYQSRQVVTKILVDGPNIITADISKGYRQILVDQIHSAKADAYDTLLT